MFGIERFRPLEKRHAILAVLSLVDGVRDHRAGPPLPGPHGLRRDARPVAHARRCGGWACSTALYLVVLLVEVWSMFTPHPTIHQWACTAAAMIAIARPDDAGRSCSGCCRAKTLLARAADAGDHGRLGVPRRDGAPGASCSGPSGGSASRTASARSRLGIPSIRLLLGIGLVIVGALLIRQARRRASRATSPGSATRRSRWSPGRWRSRSGSSGCCCGLVVPLLVVTMPMTRTPAWLRRGRSSRSVGVFVDRYLFVDGRPDRADHRGRGHRLQPVRRVHADARRDRARRWAPARSWPSSTRSPSAISTSRRATSTSSSPGPWTKPDHDDERADARGTARRPRRPPARPRSPRVAAARAEGAGS